LTPERAKMLECLAIDKSHIIKQTRSRSRAQNSTFHSQTSREKV